MVKLPRKPPPALDDEQFDKLLTFLRTGHYVEIACEMAGIHNQRMYEWLRYGRELSELDRDLTDAEQHAVAVGEAITSARYAARHRNMHAIQQAATGGTWQAAAWFLERTDPDHYSRRTEVTGAEGGPVQVSVEQVEHKIAALLGEGTDDVADETD